QDEVALDGDLALGGGGHGAPADLHLVDPRLCRDLAGVPGPVPARLSVGVELVGVRDRDAVVDRVADAVAICIGLRRAVGTGPTDRRHQEQRQGDAQARPEAPGAWTGTLAGVRHGSPLLALVVCWPLGTPPPLWRRRGATPLACAPSTEKRAF